MSILPSGLWLVRAETEGPGSSAMGKLTELNDAYIKFIEMAKTLASQNVWAQRSKLDAEVRALLGGRQGKGFAPLKALDGDILNEVRALLVLVWF